MITDNILGLLWDTGHFQNPKYPIVVQSRDEALRQSLNSDAVKNAIKSYQEFFPEQFDKFSLEAHNRLGIADGEAGPATERLFNMARCACPDYTIEAANGSGSWPVGCNPQFPNNHSFGIKIGNQIPAFLAPQFELIFNKVVRAYANIGIIFFRSDSNYDTLTTFVTLGGSTIGLAIVPSNPRCSDQIWSRFDPGYRPSDLVNQWARLLAHEWGHNMGLSHSRGGIMNPSIVSGVFTDDAWRNDPSFPILKRWFGGQPVGGVTTTTPDLPGPNPGIPMFFQGEFEAIKDGKSLGKFILVPKPQV